MPTACATIRLGLSLLLTVVLVQPVFLPAARAAHYAVKGLGPTTP